MQAAELTNRASCFTGLLLTGTQQSWGLATGLATVAYMAFNKFSSMVAGLVS